MHTHRPARLLAAAALALVLPLSACGAVTSHSSHCSGGTCTINLSGVQTFEVDGTDGLERDLGVGPIEPDAVTVSVYGEQARLAAGQSGVVAEVPVEVVSVSGRDVTLRIAGIEVESADDDDSSASGTGHRSTTTKTTKSTATKAAKATATKATATKSRSASR